jgi:hypothetical protein
LIIDGHHHHLRIIIICASSSSDDSDELLTAIRLRFLEGGADDDDVDGISPSF